LQSLGESGLENVVAKKKRRKAQKTYLVEDVDSKENACDDNVAGEFVAGLLQGGLNALEEKGRKTKPRRSRKKKTSEVEEDLAKEKKTSEVEEDDCFAGNFIAGLFEGALDSLGGESDEVEEVVFLDDEDREDLQKRLQDILNEMKFKRLSYFAQMQVLIKTARIDKHLREVVRPQEEVLRVWSWALRRAGVPLEFKKNKNFNDKHRDCFCATVRFFFVFELFALTCCEEDLSDKSFSKLASEREEVCMLAKDCVKQAFGKCVSQLSEKDKAALAVYYNSPPF
jgi:hypothetical protein